MHWTAADKYFSAILITKNIWLQGCYLIFLPAILFRIRMEEQDVSAVPKIAGKCQKIVVKYLKSTFRSHYNRVEDAHRQIK